MSDELKPCPFCGSEAVFERIPVGYHPICSGCGLQMMNGSVGVGWYATKEDAAKDWNTRAQPLDGALTNEGAEPVAYAVFTDKGHIRIWSSDCKAVGLRVEAEEGRPAVPLYRHPPKVCTCPSGDGSLRWPCPVHAPEVKVFVLPEFNEWYVGANLKMTRGQIEMGSMIWRACLDRVKEMNS